MINDKHNILNKLHTYDVLRLELGCGNRKRLINSIGVDILDYESVDIIGDVNDVLKKFPDNSVDIISSHHFVEHVSDIDILMDELARVLKLNGEIDFTVPHFSNPYFYSDYTHKSFFGLYTFCYFASNRIFKRKVPTYKKRIRYEILNVDLIFKSPPPFYFRYVFKKFFGLFFNLNNFMKELYEENLCYLVPCYEIRYKLKKIL